MSPTAAAFRFCVCIVACLFLPSAFAYLERSRLSQSHPFKLNDGYDIHLYTYTAKGWDYTSIDDSILEANLDFLEENGLQPQNASATDTIFVYPDFAFTTTEVINNRTLAVLLSQRVPAVSNETVPCIVTSTNPKELVVQRLSCIARSKYIYLVAGLLEAVPCTEGEPCRDDGVKVYSTAVVLDKQGYLIAKYRKYNLINEQAFDKPASLEPATFTTESGIKQGIFMSHDLLFAEPANTFFKNGVHRFVDLGAMVNSMPFGFSVTVQWGWHCANKENNIALASSAYQNAFIGYTGNGIIKPTGDYYLQYGPGANTLGIMTTQVIKSVRAVQEEVPIYSEETDFTNYASVPVPFSTFPNEVSICHGESGFCCTLKYWMIQSANEMFYQLVAFDGKRTARDGRVLFPEQTCGLVACSSVDKLSCGAPVEATNYTREVSFAHLSLKGSFLSKKVIPVAMEAETYFNYSYLNMTVLPNGNRFDVNITATPATLTIKTFALMSTDYSA